MWPSATDPAMQNLPNLLFFAGGIVLLVVIAFFSTAQSDGAGFVELPTVAPTPAVSIPQNCPLTPAGSRGGYRSGAPQTTRPQSPPDFEALGQRLIIFGRVFASDCRTPLPDTLIEVWQTNPEGSYDTSANFYLRGQFRTDTGGGYKFATIAPGRYLRNGKLQPAHIHFRISRAGQAPFFTQLYFSDDPYLSNLPAAPLPPIAKLVEKSGPNGITWHAQFDLVLPLPPP